MPFLNIKNSDYTERFRKTVPAVMILVCVYIFLFIERPWESVSYLEGIPIERPFAVLMIIATILAGKFRVVSAATNKWVYGILGLHFILWPFAFNQDFGIETAIEFGKMVVLYFVMLSIAEDEPSLKLLVKVFVFSMMFYVVHSLWEYHNGRHVWRMGIARLCGVGDTLSDPNAFGASVVLSLPFAYALLKAENRKLTRMIYYGYFALGIICVVLTGSRSAAIAFTAFIILLGFEKKGRKKLLTMVIIILGVSAIWFFMPEDKQARIQTLWDKDAGPANAYESAAGRLIGWNVSWEMFKREPLTGVGAGGKNFIGYRMAYPVDAPGQQSPHQSHNLYGQVLAEQGIFGAILFVGLVFSIAKSAITILRIKSAATPGHDFMLLLSKAVIMCLVLLLLLGFGGHNFYRPLWLWLAAWSSALININNNKTLASNYPYG